jgi:selenocysteine-specific elongation factor
LEKQELKPGEEGWLQLEPVEDVVAVRGDRYILRRPSPGETLGGGVVLDSHPERRYKRFSPAVIDRLEALAAGTPEEVFQQALIALGAGPYQAVVKASNLGEEAASTALEALIASHQALILQGDGRNIKANTIIASAAYWSSLKERSIQTVGRYHEANPLRRGMPREELKSKLKLETALFNAVIARMISENDLEEQGPLVFAPGHEIAFSPAQQEKIDRLLARFAKAPFAPPSVKDCMAEVGEDVYQALVDLGNLLQLSPEVAFRPQDYQQAAADVKGLIEKEGSLALAQARDHWGTTRRYVQALLEYMDAQGLTVRKGDARVLRQ